MDNQTPDTLGETLVESGFAPNLYLLDINHALSVPRDFPLPAPWNLPSRMFEYPIEVCSPDGDQPRKIGLRHPLLADHPFVRHVEAALGVEIDRNGAPNRYGYMTAPTARWWHAVDLISAGKWRELLDTQDFTDPGCIMRAVAYGCRYSHHEDKKAAGYITTTEAREIMREVGATEPDERSAAVLAFSAPSLCRQDNGSEHWPINHGRLCAEDVAWGFIIGVEDGWFRHDRSGHLQWTELGRERYAAGDRATYTAQSARSCDFGHLGEHVGNGLVVVDDRPCEERRSAPIRERRYEPWRFEWGSDRLLEPEFFGHRVRDRQSGDGTTGIGGSA